MATQKGQNLRVLIVSGEPASAQCVAMATNCVITLTNNTEQSDTKDTTGMSAKPTVASKGWSVQVDSLNVMDVAALLSAINNNTKTTLIWDQTSTENNTSMEHASYARKGDAYINDLNIVFNDRENSSKTIQFTGTSAIEAVPAQQAESSPSASAYTKGQYVRLFLGSDLSVPTPPKVIGAAKQLSLHVSVQMENASTKDTTGDWEIQEPVGISYDITSNALVSSGETISSGVPANTLSDIEDMYESGSLVRWQIASVSGNNNRTKGNSLVYGTAIVASLQINAQNRQSATYNIQLTGYGDYNVG